VVPTFSEHADTFFNPRVRTEKVVPTFSEHADTFFNPRVHTEKVVSTFSEHADTFLIRVFAPKKWCPLFLNTL
jgi:hypothetical protein